MQKVRGKNIAKLYLDSPIDMLALKVADIFTEIKTDADKVRHNDALADIQDIINDSYPAQGQMTNKTRWFISKVADFILYPAKNDFRRKRLLFRMAEQALNVGNVKGK